MASETGYAIRIVGFLKTEPGNIDAELFKRAHDAEGRAIAAQARVTELEAALAQAREDYHELYVQNMQTETALALKSRTPT